MTDPWAGFLISSVAWLGMRHSEAIAEVREAGFGGVEILCKPGHFEHDDPEHVREAEIALADWPEAIVTFHAPFYEVDLASSDGASWDYALRVAMQAIEVASRLRAGNVTLHTRSITNMGQWDRENLDAFLRALDQLVDAVQRRNMTLAVENLPPPYYTSHEEDLLRLIEGYPAHLLGVCLDTGHAHLGGRVVELSRSLAPRGLIAHLHDNLGHDGDKHLIPGEGTIPWKEVIEALAGFRGRLVIESVRVGDLEVLKKAIMETGLSELTAAGMGK